MEQKKKTHLSSFSSALKENIKQMLLQLISSSHANT